ncbi:Endonuclease/exonuclease/phosphatase [Auriculariales sp. MPI-PUGE-AT-0066]|nr:Endonuclease/exonuclease/phosphatase [Auriculariales sp. MPI-PUGE-AT-0066]
MADAQQGLLVQILSYNTNLQGSRGVPQDLVDWLSPALHVSSFLANRSPAPDIVAVGFQELLPLHFGLTGMSKTVMRSRDELILSQIEKNAPKGERYVLVGKIVYVGCALLVYARDDTVGRRVTNVQTQWTGFGPLYMGNKSAVGVRFDVKGLNGKPDETFTFVNAHLTAHKPNAKLRALDWERIVSTLLFSNTDATLSNIYDSTHLFVHGDLNFRLHIPRNYQADGVFLGAPGNHDLVVQRLKSDGGRREVAQFDELTLARQNPNSTLLQGLHEGDFVQFKCSYKFVLGEVDQYSSSREPAWTDRILFASAADAANSSKSAITPLLYTTVPSYTTSDHKPLIALLHVSPTTTARLRQPTHKALQPASYAHFVRTRWQGKAIGWVVGWIWTLLWLLGIGQPALGVANFAVGITALGWWRKSGTAASVGP